MFGHLLKPDQGVTFSHFYYQFEVQDGALVKEASVLLTASCSDSVHSEIFHLNQKKL